MNIDGEPARALAWRAGIINDIDQYGRKVVIEQEDHDYIRGYFSEIDVHTYKDGRVIRTERVQTRAPFWYRTKPLEQEKGG